MTRKYVMKKRVVRSKEDIKEYQRQYYLENKKKDKNYKELIGDLKYIAENWKEFSFQ